MRRSNRSVSRFSLLPHSADGLSQHRVSAALTAFIRAAFAPQPGSGYFIGRPPPTSVIFQSELRSTVTV